MLAFGDMEYNLLWQSSPDSDHFNHVSAAAPSDSFGCSLWPKCWMNLPPFTCGNLPPSRFNAHDLLIQFGEIRILLFNFWLLQIHKVQCLATSSIFYGWNNAQPLIFMSFLAMKATPALVESVCLSEDFHGRLFDVQFFHMPVPSLLTEEEPQHLAALLMWFCMRVTSGESQNVKHL